MQDYLIAGLLLGYLLNFLFIPKALLTRKRHPTATVAWVLALFVLPYIATLLFLVFGINRVQRRAVHKSQSSQQIAARLPSLDPYEIEQGDSSDKFSDQQRRLIILATKVTGNEPTFGNSIELLSDTNQTFGLIGQAIRGAKQSLHLEYYIWQPDRTGTKLRDLLIEKANEGVKVRFLYDGLGSMHLSRKFLQPVYDSGIEIAAFLPGATLRERWSINLRNHRKIVIVDGKVGFTGGMNIGDEYLGKNPHIGFWRDTHLKMTGPAVRQLQQTFAEDWFYATGEELTDESLFPEPDTSGPYAAQVIPGGPDGQYDAMQSVMFEAINDSRHQITIATSYFIPPPSMMTALESAAHRGVKVRLMLAGKAVYYATVLAGRSYYNTLLKAGIEIYEYDKGLMHSKTLTVDDDIAFVGSPNFDSRSLLLNFELGVFIFSSQFVEFLQKDFERDCQAAIQIDQETWSKRSIWSRLGESIFRLFAPAW